VDELISDAELVELEALVQEALRSGDRSALDLRGFGVTSVVLAAPVGSPRVAGKRVPPFVDHEAFAAYRRVVLDNVAALTAAGLHVVDTDVRLVELGGHLAGYVVQPLLPVDALAEAVLKASAPSPEHPLVVAVVDHVMTATSDCLGVDAQVGNWAVVDGVVAYIDVTTPFSVDDQGDIEVDLDVFLRSGPPIMRPIYLRELPTSMKRWLDPRHALLDLVGNLYKLDLDDWVQPIIAATAGRVEPPITVEEARDYYSGEVKTWTMLNRVLRAYDWWRRKVRRHAPTMFVPPPDYDPVAWKAKQAAWR